MTVKSFEDLDFLLPEDARSGLQKERERSSKEKEYRRKVAYEKYDGRPKSRYTNRTVLPMLPKWMRRKLMEAREMFYEDLSFGAEEDYFCWNHIMTLPLDDRHVVTFRIRDGQYFRTLDHDMPILVEVYKDLQTLYRKYGHELSFVCISSGIDPRLFGYGELPGSFYDMNNKWGMDEYISGCKDSLIRDFLGRFNGSKGESLEKMEREAIKYGEKLSKNDRKKIHTWFAYEQVLRTEYCEAVKKLLETSGHRYEWEAGWDSLVIVRERQSSEECILSIRWRFGENLAHLTQFEAVTPLLDKILRKTSKTIFSFGVKPREMCILSLPNFSARSDESK